MYDYLRGILTYTNSGTGRFSATVEVGGTGFRIELTQRDFANLPVLNSEVKIYTVLIHKEDKMSLCGFLRREERDIFNILTSVSGVGQKMALALINSFEVPALVGFVLDGDYKAITTAKGVGAKLAQKIILELKDKLTNYGETQNITIPQSGTGAINSQNADDAVQVLLSLGYEKNEISAAMNKVLTSLDEKAAAEEILKEALKILSE